MADGVPPPALVSKRIFAQQVQPRALVRSSLLDICAKVERYDFIDVDGHDSILQGWE